MSSPQRILLIRLSHLGDVVHALPVYHALRASHPRARIGWVTQPEFAGLVEGLPGLERVFHFGRSEGARAWPRLAAELASFSADLVVDAQGNLKSAAAALCAGSARRTGLHRRDWREPAGAWVLHDSAPPVDKEEPHAMDRMLGLARYLSTNGEAALCTDPALSAAELETGRARCREFFPPRPAEQEGRDFLLQLSRPDDVRSWPVDHLIELARTLAQSEARVLVLSGPREAESGCAAERALAALDRVRHWIGQRGLRELAAFFAACAESGVAFVGSDSGPMHLAAACGMRVVSLAGPQSHLRTGPWPIPPSTHPGAGNSSATNDAHAKTIGAPLASDHLVLRSPTPPPCAPCFDRRCTHAEGPVCMSGIPSSLVLSALLART